MHEHINALPICDLSYVHFGDCINHRHSIGMLYEIVGVLLEPQLSTHAKQYSSIGFHLKLCGVSR